MTHHSNQPDWSIDVEAPPKVAAPSFIRLFVIRRVFAECVFNKEKITDIDTQLKNLIAVFTDDKIRQLSYNILYRLWNGLKSYMRTWYNEKEQATTIEMIFTDIILTKFTKQYQIMTTYMSNNTKEHYNQCLVFNTDNLMYLIFQFLHFWNGELYNCTFVNTHWLYQIWNSTSLYRINLTSLINQTLKWKQGDENTCTRMWQRIIYAKHIELRMERDKNPSKLLLNRLAMLVNVRGIKYDFNGMHHSAVLKILMKNCKHKIEQFEICFTWPGNFIVHNVMSPLILSNVKRIQVNTSYFYITWGASCHKLLLLPNEFLFDQHWCNHVIYNCDCSGIISLQLIKLQFQMTMDKSTKILLKKFAQKFGNIKYLQVDVDNIDHFEHNRQILQSFKNIVLQNDCCVGLKLRTDCWDKTKVAPIDCKIDILSIEIRIGDHDHDVSRIKSLKETFESIGNTVTSARRITLDCNRIQFMSLTLLECLKQINIIEVNNLNQGDSHPTKKLEENIISNTNSASKYKCAFSPSIQTVEIIVNFANQSFDEMNEFLTSKMLWQLGNELFVRCKIEFCYFVKFEGDWTPKKLQPSLIDFFNAMYCFLGEKRIPMDISVVCVGMGQDINNIIKNIQNQDKCILFFDKQKIKQNYQAPNLNQTHKKCCVALAEPIILFDYDSSSNKAVFRFANANDSF